jgi:FAD binding domain/Berberine and berberine like
VDRRDFVVGTAWTLLGQRVARLDPRVRELERVVRGPVLTPSSSSQLVFNERYEHVRPLAVVRPRDARDVQAVIRWARRRHVRVIPRSGGHGYGGYSTGAGVVLDLSRLRGVHLAGRTAVIGPGTILYDVYAKLAAHGGTIPAGSCPTVGFGGLALGGGVGLASRKLGTTSDNVVAMRVATGDGRLLDVDARHHADLFWALRGGGGRNFGVVTSFRVRVTPTRSGAWFAATYDWAEAPDVVPAWQRWCSTTSPAFFTICSLGSARTLQVFGQYWGSDTAMRSALPPFVRNSARLRTGSATYLDLMLRWAGCLGETPAACRTPRRSTFAAKSDYVTRPMPAQAVRTLQERMERARGRGAVLMDSYGGALRHTKGAFRHRNAICSLQELVYWDGRAGDALRWLRGVHAGLRPYVDGRAYVNYIDPELADWRHAYYGPSLPRLVATRKRYDPDRVFRFEQGV